MYKCFFIVLKCFVYKILLKKICENLPASPKLLSYKICIKNMEYWASQYHIP